eukprot:g29344.t1
MTSLHARTNRKQRNIGNLCCAAPYLVPHAWIATRRLCKYHATATPSIVWCQTSAPGIPATPTIIRLAPCFRPRLSARHSAHKSL